MFEVRQQRRRAHEHIQAWRCWSTFGPHAIGTERFATVSSGASLRRSPVRSCGNKPPCRTLIRMRS
jgi:hypothetical protein